jgi:hypothetical protein
MQTLDDVINQIKASNRAVIPYLNGGSRGVPCLGCARGSVRTPFCPRCANKNCWIRCSDATRGAIRQTFDGGFQPGVNDIVFMDLGEQVRIELEMESKVTTLETIAKNRQIMGGTKTVLLNRFSTCNAQLN